MYLDQYIFKIEETLSSQTLNWILWFTMMALPLLIMGDLSFFADSTTRLIANEAFLSTYYFWWTNLTYLATFFVLLVFLVVASSPSSISNRNIFWLLLLFSVYMTEVLDYNILNLSDSIAIYSSTGLNTLLTNLLNHYHPFIFYTSVAILLKFFSQSFLTYAPQTTFKASSILPFLKKVVWSAVMLNLVSLWLGSWWALQEGTWGGWWNWDSSEVFGLLVGASLLALGHTSYHRTSLLNFKLHQIVLTALVLISYFFIQLNFELVSHNFGSKFFFFFNNNLFFLEALICLSVIVLAALTTFVHSSRLSPSLNDMNHLYNQTFGNYIRPLPHFLLLYWVCWAYQPLLSYFLWNFLEINLLNTERSLQLANTAAALILLGSVSSLYQWHFWVLLGATLSATSLWPLALLLFLPVTNLYQLIHGLLFLFFLLTVMFFNSTWLSPSYISYLGFNLTSLSLSFSSNTLLVLDSLFIDSGNMVFTHNGTSFVSWNLYSSFNALATNSFLLELVQNAAVNQYIMSDLYLFFTLLIDLPIEGLLSTLFAMLMIFLFKMMIHPHSAYPL